MEIKTHYIDFKTAKLLKEKGFKGIVFYTDGTTHTAPEQWQVCEWLRVVHGIWVEVGVGNLFHKDKFYILIKKYNIDRWDLTSLDNKTHSPYDIPQEAYSAAFDYILTNLI